MARTQAQDDEARRQAEQEAQREKAIQDEQKRQEDAKTQDESAVKAGVQPQARAVQTRQEQKAERRPGVYIRNSRLAPDGKHYGGQVVDSNGVVLNEFEKDQVNTGGPK